MRTPTDGGSLMANYPLDLLARANPVRETPAVEAPERLRQMIEAAGPEAPVSREGRNWARPRVLQAMVATALVGAAVALGLALTNSSSNTHLSVVASAYAALSPEDGILEASFVKRETLRHKRVTIHEREWIDARTGIQRIRYDFAGAPAERALGDRWLEAWNGAAGHQHVIERIHLSIPLDRGKAVSALDAYRKLYLDKRIRLVGQVRWHGQLLWKLEGPGSGYMKSPHSPFVSLETIVVLVDPSTYLPVVRQNISLIKPGHPVETETELVKYKRLPVTPQNEALLRVYTQHPNARIETPPASRPKQIRGRRAR